MLVPIVVGIWVATGGLVVPRNRILSQFLGIYYTNPLQYALDGLTSIAFYCDVNKTACMNNGMNGACRLDQSACPTCDCPRLNDSTPVNTFVWTQISTNRSLDYSWVGYDMLALAVAAVIIRFLTFLAAKYLKHGLKDRKA